MVDRKIKAIEAPELGVAGHYGKCRLCGEETSWTVNGKHVCPPCCVANGWVKKSQLPDACAVCGAQGEWVAGNGRSLCHRHRDAWMGWPKRDNLLKGYHQLPKAEKSVVWDKCFDTFVREARGEIKTCPYCGQTAEKVHE